MKQTLEIIIVCIVFLISALPLFAQETANPNEENSSSQEQKPEIQDSLPSREIFVEPKVDTHRFTHKLQFQGIASNLGSGIHGGYHLNNKYYYGLDILTLTIHSSAQSASGGTIKTDGQLATDIISIRYFPFNSSGFYVHGGVALRNWIVDATSTSNSGEEEFTIHLEFPRTAAFFGIGGNWITKLGISGGLGVGLIVGDSPTASGEDKVGNLQTELESELDKITNDFQEYATFPLIYGNLGLSF